MTDNLEQGSERESLDDFLRAIDAEIATRRSEGSSAPGIDAQLERHFSLVRGDLNRDLELVRDRIDGIASTLAARFDPALASSKVPGGGFFHRVVGRLTRRHVSPAFDAIEACRVALESLTDVVADLERRARRDADRLSYLESAPSSGPDGPARPGEGPLAL